MQPNGSPQSPANSTWAPSAPPRPKPRNVTSPMPLPVSTKSQPDDGMRMTQGSSCHGFDTSWKGFHALMRGDCRQYGCFLCPPARTFYTRHARRTVSFPATSTWTVCVTAYPGPTTVAVSKSCVSRNKRRIRTPSKPTWGRNQFVSISHPLRISRSLPTT